MQLVAYGAQDIYLTGNPQITFFKVVYRRHTNFSMEAIQQTINATPSDGGNSTVTISRNGDLVYKVYVTSTAAATNGSKIVSEVELEIGGQKIDKHYEEWNQIWNELSTPESKAIGLKSMVGDIGTAGSADSTGPLMTQYPLNFWFCRNPGLALPLIALQYHEVKLKFTWGTGAAQGVDSNVKVLCDYIYLDTDERRRFAQVSHEYLIEQIQKETFNSTDSKKLNFNHPVKELIWTSQASSGYTKAKLKLNGHDRFAEQNAEYFQLRQPFDYHTAIPKQNLPLSAQIGLSNNTISNLTHISTAGPLVGVASNGVSDNVKICVVDGTKLEIHADHVANLSIGDTLVLVLIVAGHEDSMVESPAYTEAIGDVFFSNVVASADGEIGAGSQADPVKLGSPFTFNGTNTVSSIVVGSGASQYELYKVTNSPLSQARTSQLTKKINVYSFGLKPEEHQPSGTCNFSRIDNAQLDFSGGGTAPASGDHIYAVNYNVLRIMSGMGGLAYSN